MLNIPLIEFEYPNSNALIFYQLGQGTGENLLKQHFKKASEKN